MPGAPAPFPRVTHLNLLSSKEPAAVTSGLYQRPSSYEILNLIRKVTEILQEWQAAEREASDDIVTGRVREFDKVDDLISSLNKAHSLPQAQLWNPWGSALILRNIRPHDKVLRNP
jgi:hypothetical protein